MIYIKYLLFLFSFGSIFICQSANQASVSVDAIAVKSVSSVPPSVSSLRPPLVLNTLSERSWLLELPECKLEIANYSKAENAGLLVSGMLEIIIGASAMALFPYYYSGAIVGATSLGGLCGGLIGDGAVRLSKFSYGLAFQETPAQCYVGSALHFSLALLTSLFVFPYLDRHDTGAKVVTGLLVGGHVAFGSYYLYKASRVGTKGLTIATF